MSVQPTGSRSKRSLELRQSPARKTRRPHALSADRISELAQSFFAAKALLSAVELDVFTVLADGPLGLRSATTRLGLASRGARDFLDALVALGMLERDVRGRYANTPETARFLDRRQPDFIGGRLESMNARNYPVWGSLTAALRTGAPQAKMSAAGNFGALVADRAMFGRFVSSMSAQTLPVAAALIERFPWRDVATIADIGTAGGCLPVELLRAFPHLKGVGFDRPPMGPFFERHARANGMSRRLRFQAGDFFGEPLPGADVLVLGRVLHNWDLARKRQLIGKAYAALGKGGTLIVHERLIDDDRRTNAPALLSSLNMLLMSEGGFDFSAADCIGWMKAAGFRKMRTAPLTSEQTMVVGVK